MPYHLEQSGPGYYVVGPSGRHSKKPMPKRRAILQMRALYAAEKKADYPDQRQFAGYTMEDWDDTKPDSFYHDTRPSARAKDTCTCATVKGERIAPGITRIRGNLCNVHGRYGPCDAATGARATIDRNKRINAARAGQGGGKGRKPRAPRKTEAQRAAEREERKRVRDAEREAKRVEADTARRAERDRLLSESGLSNQVRDALVDAAAGDTLAPQNGAELVKLGLAEQGEDGSYRLSPKGRQVVNAANRGDAGSLRDAMGEARDQTARGQRRATERATRQQQAAQRRQEAEARRAARGGGGGGSAKPKKDEPKPAPRRPAPRRSAGGGSRGPSAASSAGNISRRAEARRRREERARRETTRQRERAQDQQRRQQEQAERSRVTTPALANMARKLSESGKVSDADAEALIRNGLARRDRDGRMVLTGTGLRASRQKAHTFKAITPVRVLDAGHTGVMVALYPDDKAIAQLVATEGVTEPAEQLHLTLCYLGDSTEAPLATNKEKVIGAVAEWAQRHGQSMKGTINGLGRFFHSEEDGTNAVYVSPDVSGLPEQRQSLVEWVEASGFDYSQDHGFTPHITVAYVPKDAPTPTIRVETPVNFDRVTLAWGDEQYEFPLGISAQKSFAVFKDAAGQWRWITRTTTAFEDRDREVISTKALEADVARADGDGKYGPLRWWHVGEPNPLDKEAPWGPGVDLGMCDFNALSGRTLIESGTFKSEEIARAVASKVDQLEISPGFFHDRRTDPDKDGVFHRIYRFERSLVPIWAGRASNLYTGLMVEGAPMDDKKKAALKELGISDETYNSLIGTVEQTEKAADQAGIRYKDADPILAALKVFIGDTVREALAGAVAADEPPVVEEKAAVTKDDGEGDMEVMAEEPEVEEQADGMEDAGGLTLSPEDITAIGEAVAAAIQASLAPLVGAMDMETKMRGHLNEIKGLFGNYTTTKDAETAQTKAKVENIDARLKELEGDQPAVQSTRPSRDSATAIRTDAELLAVVKAANNGAGPFDDIISNLGLGPQN